MIKMGFFLYSAKAFHELEQIDNNEEYVEGKRGACCGVFQLIIAGKEDRWDWLQQVEVKR